MLFRSQFLGQMFGWGVADAIATYKKASENPKLLGALLLFGSTPDIIHHYKVEGRYAIGYDESHGEMVRVPLREPIHIRVVYDDRHNAVRTNMT